MSDGDAAVPGRDNEHVSPFTSGQTARIERALAIADVATGLTFMVYIGDLHEPSRQHAESLHERMIDPATSVLLAVSPNQRVLEIVTGERAHVRLPDRICEIAALSMVSAFCGGDLAGGVLAGIAQLADHAGQINTDGGRHQL